MLRATTHVLTVLVWTGALLVGQAGLRRKFEILRCDSACLVRDLELIQILLHELRLIVNTDQIFQE